MQSPRTILLATLAALLVLATAASVDARARTLYMKPNCNSNYLVADTWNFRSIKFEVQQPALSNPFDGQRFHWTIFEPTYKTQYPMSHYAKSKKYVIGYDYTKPGAVFDSATRTLQVTPNGELLTVVVGKDATITVQSAAGVVYAVSNIIEPEAVPPFNPDTATYDKGGCLNVGRFRQGPRPDWEVKYDDAVLPPQVVVALTYIQSRKDFKLAALPEAVPEPAVPEPAAEGGPAPSFFRRIASPAIGIDIDA